MLEEAAKNLLRETFARPYDRDRFKTFARNLVSGYDERHKTGQIPDSFKDHIQSLYRIGKIVDSDASEIDLIEVKLKRTASVHRARAMQRNFVARYLKRRDKDAALVAFVSQDDENWRFSLVTQEHQLFEDLKGRIKTKAILTPAKRLSFRVGAGEKTHTAMRQMLPILVNDAMPTLGILRRAFSVETVSKEFFEKYRELFYRTVEALDKFLETDAEITKHFADRGIETADFAKRLLGQIVFLYFLQKKGWLGVPADGKWGDGDRGFLRTLFEKADKNGENFFDQYLEPLFYDALAVDNSPEDDFHDRFNCRLPFLNGGLFEPYNDYQWQKMTILIENALFSNSFTTTEGDIGDGILDIFDRYNFTVAEDEPLEKEVAVDPEMLGKVFENLLEVKNRRQSGTYYTPREIVHYMCQESLIAYLARRVPAVPKDDIETFIRYSELFLETDAEVRDRKAGKKGSKGAESRIYGEYLLPDTVRDAAADLDAALATVRVCDPAIGSGAFPVGMMTEIVRARTALGQYLGHEETPYRLKLQSIHDSLYGVDIDPGAVEIAKLRLWLSLVVDEEAYDHVQPLPNLDYRIMQGNSLLDTYEGIKLFDDSILATDLDTQDKETIKARLTVRQKELAVELRALATQPLNAKLKSRRKEINAEAAKTLKALKALEAAADDGTTGMPLLDPLSEAARKDLRLRGLHDEYFYATERSKKIALRKEIDDVEWELIEASLKENGKTDRLEDVERYRRTKTRPFFLWRLNFSEVFHPELDNDNGDPRSSGFDVVIANPPYISHDRIRDKDALKETYASFEPYADIYCYFLELAALLLSRYGTMCFITSNSYIRAEYGAPLRKFLKTKTDIQRVVSISRHQVFDAAIVNTAVFLAQSRSTFSAGNLCEVLEAQYDGLTPFDVFVQQNSFSIKRSRLGEYPWILVPESVSALIGSLRDGSKTLEQLGAKIRLGLATGANYAFVIDKNTKARLTRANSSSSKLIKKVIGGRDIQRWRIKESEKYIILSLDGLNLANDHPGLLKYFNRFDERFRVRGAQGKHWYNLRPCAFVDDFKKEKIVWIELSDKARFALSDKEIYLLNTAYFLLCPSEINIKCLLGILNSRVIYFFMKITSQTSGMGTMRWINHHVKDFPIPEIAGDMQKKVSGLVEGILATLNNDPLADVSDQEAKIDQLVYQLYSLTDEEVALIESSLASGES